MGKKELLTDLIGLAGGVLLTIGAALIYVPAGFIVSGFLLLAGAYLAAKGGV